MTNREKIEEFLATNPLFINWYYVSTIDDNLYTYYMDFADDATWDGLYDCSVNVDETINYVRHIMQ